MRVHMYVERIISEFIDLERRLCVDRCEVIHDNARKCIVCMMFSPVLIWFVSNNFERTRW